MSNATFNLFNFPWGWGNSAEGRGFFGLFKGSPKSVKATEGSVQTASSRYLGPDEATQISAILSAVRVISQGVAQVDRQLEQKTFDDKKSRWTSKIIYDRVDGLDTLLRERPNNYQTMYEFLECMTARAALSGNSYAIIIRSVRRVLELHPIPTHQVKTLMDENRNVYYEISINGGQTKRYEFNEVLHIRGPSLGSILGDNILAKASMALELALAAEYSQLETLRRRGRRDGIVSHPGQVTSDRIEKINEAFTSKFGGNGNGGIAILDQGASFNDFTQSAKDMELIEHRRFAVDEAGRFFGVYSQLLNQHAANSAYASVEQVFIAHETNTIEPWFVRIEEAIKRDVIGYTGENKAVYFKFARGSLTKGTMKDVAENIKVLVLMGVLTANEARAKLGMNPLDIEGADEPMTQLNMRLGYTPTQHELNQALNPNPGQNDPGATND